MRVLVVTNLVPDAATPQRGRWVRDQVAAIRARGIEVEEFGFPRGRSNYLPATRALRALLRRERFDLVHAHYGLAGWVARAAGARPLLVTFHGTDVRHPVVGPMSRRLAWGADMASAVSRALFAEEDGRPGLPPVPGSAVLPCGPALDRFGPTPRAAARDARPRSRRPLSPLPRRSRPPGEAGRPRRRARRRRRRDAPHRRLDRAGGDEHLMNAADSVLVTSDYEGFGMAAIEALACDVPVLSTPVGVAPYLLAGIEGCLCAPFDAERWAAAARPHLAAKDPRVAGSARAATLASGPMAERVIEVYRHLTVGAG